MKFLEEIRCQSLKISITYQKLTKRIHKNQHYIFYSKMSLKTVQYLRERSHTESIEKYTL